MMNGSDCLSLRIEYPAQVSSVGRRLGCRIHPTPKGAGILLVLYENRRIDEDDFSVASHTGSVFDDGAECIQNDVCFQGRAFLFTSYNPVCNGPVDVFAGVVECDGSRGTWLRSVRGLR